MIDFSFLEFKINHSEFGLESLIADYNLIDEPELKSEPEYNPEKIKTLKLLQEALKLAAHILKRDKTQLVQQLWGRMQGFQVPEIQQMLSTAQQRKATWLRPLTTSLTPPGGCLRRTLSGHSDWVRAVAVTPDGKTAISGSDDYTLKLWDLETGEEIRTLSGHNDSVSAVAVTPDGKTAISGSDDYTLKLWDLETGEEIRTLSGHSHWVSAVAVTPDGKTAISGSDDYTLKLWDLETREEIRTLSGHSHWVSAVAVTTDGKKAISGSSDKTLKLWDVETGEEIRTLSGHSDSVSAVAVTPDGKRAISGSYDNTLKLWDVETGEEIRTLSGHSDWVWAVAVTPDGKTAISGSSDNTLKVWDLETGEEIRTLSGHNDSVSAVAVTPDGKKVISGSDDKTLKLWEFETWEEKRTPSGHSHWVSAVAVTPDGKKVISGSDDKTLKLWDLETGEEIRTFKEHSDSVSAVAVTPDGKRAISGSYNYTLQLWDLETGEEIRTFKEHSDSVSAVTVTPDGKTAISDSYDNTLKLWDLETGKEIRTFSGHSDSVSAVAVTPDGKTAISGSYDNTLKLWDVETGEEIRTLSGHSDWVWAVAVTPDGKTAISGSSDKTLKLWDLETGEEIRTFSGHSDSVMAVAVTLDGKRAISGSYDETLKLWDLSNSNEIASFTGESRLSCCGVTPDGMTIVAGEASGRVHFLRLELPPQLPNLYPTDFQQLIRSKSANFLGREFVFDEITKFLHRYKRGYFTIIGAPGRGKSAILAKYVRENILVVYYNAQLEGKNLSNEFLQNICSQLMSLLGKREITSLPDNATHGSWFLSELLQKISDLLESEQRLIVAIDAVDASVNLPPGSNLFYLPRYLPDRVYFLLTRRPFLRDKSSLLIEAPAQSLELEDYPELNREDVRRYIQEYILTTGGKSETEFIEQLTTQSENNFMYLSQILPAIAEGSYPQPLQFTPLPPGLEAYYQNHWQRMKGEELSDVKLSVLRTLVTHTAEPTLGLERIESGGISAATISEIIGEEEYEVEEVLGNWIEFLRRQEIDGEMYYSLYHANFRDFLQSELVY